MKRLIFVALLGFVSTVSAREGYEERMIVGSMLGGVIGAVIGNDAGGRDGAILGSAIGAATGTALATRDRHRVVYRDHVTVVHEHHYYRDYCCDDYRHDRGRHRGHHKHRKHHHKHHGHHRHYHED